MEPRLSTIAWDRPPWRLSGAVHAQILFFAPLGSILGRFSTKSGHHFPILANMFSCHCWFASFFVTMLTVSVDHFVCLPWLFGFSCFLLRFIRFPLFFFRLFCCSFGIFPLPRGRHKPGPANCAKPLHDIYPNNIIWKKSRSLARRCTGLPARKYPPDPLRVTSVLN